MSLLSLSTKIHDRFGSVLCFLLQKSDTVAESGDNLHDPGATYVGKKSEGPERSNNFYKIIKVTVFRYK